DGRGRAPGPPQPRRGQARGPVPRADRGAWHRRPRAPSGDRRGPAHAVPAALVTSSLTEVDHVAIAVRDLEAAIAWYRDVLGADVVHREIVDSDGVEEALVAVAESYVQLLTPTTP